MLFTEGVLVYLKEPFKSEGTRTSETETELYTRVQVWEKLHCSDLLRIKSVPICIIWNLLQIQNLNHNIGHSEHSTSRHVILLRDFIPPISWFIPVKRTYSIVYCTIFALIPHENYAISFFSILYFHHYTFRSSPCFNDNTMVKTSSLRLIIAAFALIRE